ncbi:hypothetical protein [Schleiferilactobacillus shenzhenensis]|uniref:Uncharacterized protein n=1 Tax=Schleiferilactobacillus shenzhenensis LY-73 TaxID=1231336 RepID=U4TSM6_9LACO|nr:hypothetical protein [Schleiferilactobacillus shenzhenensis]ERL64868.1 hypothetical protein L248_0472 [Schleiferilactobacillus shenzhenensis LY-73]
MAVQDGTPGDPKDIEMTSMLDKKMSEEFDWSDSNLPIRDALWDYYMEKNNHSTDQTEKDMLPTLDMSDDDVKALATKLLKK